MSLSFYRNIVCKNIVSDVILKMVLPNGINHRRDFVSFCCKETTVRRASTSLREFFIFCGIVVGCQWNKLNQFLDSLTIFLHTILR